MQNNKGFVRRLDELGRVVIPKEIRKSLKIENGNLIEFFYTTNNELKLCKFEPVRELSDFGSKILYSMRKYADFGFLLCDMQQVVAVQNFSKKDSFGKKLDAKFLEELKTKTSTFEFGSPIDANLYQKNLIFPIIVMGDCVGCLIVTTNLPNFVTIFEATKTLVQIFCDYLCE